MGPLTQTREESLWPRGEENALCYDPPPKLGENVFEQLERLANWFGSKSVTVSMGRLGLSLVRIAEGPGIIDPQDVGKLLNECKAVSVENSYIDERLKRVGGMWKHCIKSRKINQHPPILAQFEKETFRQSQGLSGKLLDVADRINQTYGTVIALLAVNILEPKFTDRLQYGFGITQGEASRVEQKAIELTNSRNSMELIEKIQALCSGQFKWSDSPKFCELYIRSCQQYQTARRQRLYEERALQQFRNASPEPDPDAGSSYDPPSSPELRGYSSPDEPWD